MTLTPEVQAAIIKVAGDWASAMATTPAFNPETGKYERPQPSEMSDELENNFDFAYRFLTGYLEKLG